MWFNGRKLNRQYEGANHDQNYYFSNFASMLISINTELGKVSKQFQYPQKHVFGKIKTFMMA